MSIGIRPFDFLTKMQKQFYVERIVFSINGVGPYIWLLIHMQ